MHCTLSVNCRHCCGKHLLPMTLSMGLITGFAFVRYLDTLAFCCTYARAAYKLPPLKKFPVGNLDLLADVVPPEVEGMVDPKTGTPAPEWLSNGAQKLPKAFRACRVALAASEIAMKLFKGVDAEEEAPAKGKKGKKGKAPEPEETAEELTAEQKERLQLAYASMDDCVKSENEIIQRR